MKQKNIQWNNKVAKYSLLASAALTMLNACGKDEEDPNDPDINETDINPDISLSAPINNFDVREFDLNNDGIMDVVVGIDNYSYSYQLPTEINNSYVEGVNGTELLTQEETFTFNSIYYGPISYTEIVVKPLAEGNTIGPSQDIWDDYGFLGISGVYYGQSVRVGQFLGQDKYVGLRIQTAGNTHYAWMRLSLSNDGSTVTVKEYAYRETPFTPINAGDK